MLNVETIIVGAGPAGLAAAASLRQRRRSSLVLEQDSAVGASWRRHYDRLHLHTHKKHSALPGYPMPDSYPRYPSRLQVVEYLEEYAKHHAIDLAFETRVTKLRQDSLWEIETTDESYQATNVVVASGFARLPNRPPWEGQEHYAGKVLHSCEFTNAEALDVARVLVVGFGNSAGEIALECAEAGLTVGLSVRSPVNVIPREMFGVPTLSIAILQQYFPYRMVDAMNRPFLRLRFGDIRRYGLQWARHGPMTQIIENGRTPLIDIGTMRLIKSGRIKIFGDIASTTDRTVLFKDGNSESFDAIIFATGYRPAIEEFLSGNGKGQEGLYFCGFHVVPTGHLRQIGLEAQDIAAAIYRKTAK